MGQIVLFGGTAVDILLRPDDLKLEADANGNGRILSRQFLGIAYMYRVALTDGTIVHSWQSHQMNFLDGMAVHATLRPQHIPLFFIKTSRYKLSFHHDWILCSDCGGKPQVMNHEKSNEG